MNYRQNLEQLEENWLHPKAARSKCSKGRLQKEIKSPFRTVFRRDRDRIIHSKAFRRLSNKTQVFISPENDHFRTRSTHSLEVMQIATDIASALRLNRDLVEAISLGHDLGHSPFGHTGEEALNELYASHLTNGRFFHAEFSLRIVDNLEKRKIEHGLNLTWETRDGILNHSKGLLNFSQMKETDDLPQTLEGQIVRIVDRIAYVSHDFDDAIQGGHFTWHSVPRKLFRLFSKGTSFVINYFAKNMIGNFTSEERIFLSQAEIEFLDLAKQFLTDSVYRHPSFLPMRNFAKQIIHFLFYYFLDYPEEMKGDFLMPYQDLQGSFYGKLRSVVDYIAGMTDRFAISQYKRLEQKKESWKYKDILRK